MDRRSDVRFALSEIARMEKLAADGQDHSAGRDGSRALQASGVQGWFLTKFPQSTSKLACLPTAPGEKSSEALASELNVSVSEEKASASEVNVLISGDKAAASEERILPLNTSVSNNEDGVPPDFPEESKDNVLEDEELEFEAKLEDSAWYDIANFLAHRMNRAVRLEGLGAEFDEWVNVKKCVRQRSIPLESSHCRSISKGDIVLCFREENEEALYFDARVVDVQRKQHDIRGCRYVFLIEYDHDSSQESVSLRRLSRRPGHQLGGSCPR